MLTIHDSELTEFGKALSEYITYHRKDVAVAMREQGRLLVKLAMDFTPPRTKGQGQRRVAADIKKALNPLVASRFDSKTMRKLIRQGNSPALEAIFRRSGRYSRVLKVGEALKPFHKAERGKRGRVDKASTIATPDNKGVREYIAQRRENVGMGKGGWAKGLTELGGKAPEWVTRHSNQGTAEIKTTSLGVSIAVHNRSPWASRGDDERIVANAIRSRAQRIRESILQHAAHSMKKKLAA